MTDEPTSIQSTEQALQALIQDPDLEHLEDLLAEFNLFDVLGIARWEQQHSAFLAWLLNPRGSHGLRDYFLRHFLADAAREARERGMTNVTPLDVDGWNLNDIDVATERHYIDILLVDEQDGFVCLIENKIGSGEIPGQLSRYLDAVKKEYAGLTPFPIFLTPDGRYPQEQEDADRWVTFDYMKIANLLERVKARRGATISPGVASFLDQYQRSLGRHVVNARDNIDELAMQIYNTHREAIDLVINAKYAVHWDIVHESMEALAPDLQRDYDSKWYHRFYAPGLEEIGALKEGSGWTESGRILLFEARYQERYLTLMMGPGPEATRTKLYDLAQRDDIPGVKMQTAANLYKEYHAIYSKRLISSRAKYDLGSEKARPAIKKAIHEFYQNDYWPLVNAIRQEFGLPPVAAG